MSADEVRPLQTGEWSQAAGIAARAMQTNPGIVWMLGDDALARTSTLYDLTLTPPSSDALAVGAWRGKLLVACAQMNREGACLGSRAKAFGTPPAFSGDAPEGDDRLLHSMAVYADNEPEWPHWHLGPIAVEPGLQGHGLGHEVMMPLIARLDRDRLPGWLETDKPENVRFYEAHGFEIDHEERRFGVDGWFMTRPAKD